MRIWTTKEAGLVKAWAAMEPQARTPLEQLADSLRRTTRSIQDFLRRELGPGKLPWREKPRWTRTVERTPEAIRKFEQRHRSPGADESRENGLTISDVARDLGVSRMYVYRLLDEGKLRRFKGRIAESSFESLLRDHPDAVPYRRLSRVQQEWLVLNGYYDPLIAVKRPSAAGLLK
jgi:transposase-like protein